MHTRSLPSYSLEPASFLQSVKHGDRNWAGRRGQPPAAAHKPQRKVEEAEEGFKKKKKKALCLGFQPSLEGKMWNKDGLNACPGATTVGTLP